MRAVPSHTTTEYEQRCERAIAQIVKPPTRRKSLFILFLLILIALSIYPFETTGVPQWRIQVVDEAGRPIPAELVSQDWEDYFAEESLT